MSIERFITAVESIAASLAKLADGTVPVTDTKPEPSEEQATKPAGRQRTTKATKDKVEAAPPKEEKVEAAKEEPEFDYEVLKRAIVELGNFGNDGRTAIIGLLGKYGVKNAKDVPVSKREELHAAAVAKLAELQNGPEDFA